MDYRRLIEEVVAKLAPHNHAPAVQLASVPKTFAATVMSRSVTSEAAKAKEVQLKADFDATKVVIGIASAEAVKAA